MKSVSFATLASIFMTGTDASGGGSYDYTYNGADWPESYPDCALTN